MKNSRANSLVLQVAISLVLVSCIPLGMNPPPTATIVPPISHEVDNFVGIEPIWIMANIYMHRNDQDTTLDSSAGIICFLGNLDERHEYYDNLICLESRSSKILWNNYSGIHDEIEVTPEGIFVTYIGPASVRKYDFQNGNLVWKNNQLGGGMGSSFLYFQDSQIEVLLLHERTTILNVDGEVSRTIDDESIFISEQDEILINYDGLYSRKANTDNISWRHEDTRINSAPLFTAYRIFVRSSFSETVYAISRTSGELLWEREIPNIVGNLVYSPDKHLLYALREEGSLLTIDENTGKESIIATFSPNPILLFDGVEDYAYQLAYDEKEKILFVYLGDSRQLFAFQEQ